MLCKTRHHHSCPHVTANVEFVPRCFSQSSGLPFVQRLLSPTQHSIACFFAKPMWCVPHPSSREVPELRSWKPRRLSPVPPQVRAVKRTTSYWLERMSSEAKESKDTTMQPKSNKVKRRYQGPKRTFPLVVQHRVAWLEEQIKRRDRLQARVTLNTILPNLQRRKRIQRNPARWAGQQSLPPWLTLVRKLSHTSESKIK